MRVLAAFNRTATILVTAKTSILRLPLPHHSGQDVVYEWALPVHHHCSELGQQGAFQSNSLILPPILFSFSYDKDSNPKMLKNAPN